MTKGIKYLSCADASGYGMAAEAYIQGLVNVGLPLTWKPLVFDRYGYIPWKPKMGPLPIAESKTSDVGINRLLGVIEAQVQYDSVLIHSTPETWPAYWENGNRRIGCTVWETDHLPLHWPQLLNNADQILVPCRFNVDVFQGDGVKCPISVIPHIYRMPADVTDEEITDFRAKLGIRDDQFVFYTINTWTARKAMHETVTAFLDALGAHEQVVFIIKTNPTGVRNEEAAALTSTAQNIAELLAGRHNIPEIRLICRQMSEREIDLLHRIGDCYFSLTHSEGWGLGAFDAAGIGNPVIITGWGGHLDYLPTGYFGLVDYRLVAVQDYRGSASYDSGQRWAQADCGHAVHLMREIVRDPGPARAVAMQNRDHILASFSEAPVINHLMSVLNGQCTA